MSIPFYVVETPRAGELNHRFLVPDDLPTVPSADKLIKLVAAAQRSDGGEGTSFLAAWHQVRQQSPNQAVREAREIIVLVGVAVAQLPSLQKKQVFEKLNSRLIDLGPVVAAWKNNSPLQGTSTVEKVTFLADWAQNDRIRELPTIRSETKPPGHISRSNWLPRWSKLPMMYKLALVFAAIIAFVFTAETLKKWFDPAGRPDVPAASASPSPELTGFADFRVALQSLAKRCRTTERELAQNILDESPGVKTREGDPVKALFTMSDVQAIISKDDAGAMKPNDLRLFVQKDKNLDDLLDVSPIPADVSLNLRRQLRDFRTACSELEQSTEATTFPEEQTWHRVVVLVRNNSFPRTNVMPVSPFFDEQDAKTVSLLASLLTEDNAPLDGMIRAMGTDVTPTQTLRKYLQFFSSRKENVINSISSKADTIVGNLIQKGRNPDPTKKATEALKRLCRAISAFAAALPSTPASHPPGT
jgi:hypothetical protein